LGTFSKKSILALAFLLVSAASTTAWGKVLLSQSEALKLAFPPGTVIERKSAFLSPADLERARSLSGSAVPGAIVTYYIGTKDGREVGTVFFDTHVVRTLQETILMEVDPAGAISRIEVLSFSEPDDYLPRPHWYEQFTGQRLGDELSLKRAIRPVTGATLTARATTDAARRVLALHALIRGAAAPPVASAGSASALPRNP